MLSKDASALEVKNFVNCSVTCSKGAVVAKVRNEQDKAAFEAIITCCSLLLPLLFASPSSSTLLASHLLSSK